MDTFISYEGLPIQSGGSHSLGKKLPGKIYQDTLSFLESFTNAKDPIKVSLSFYSSQSRSYKTLPHLWNLIRNFGYPKWDSWKPDKVRQHTWTWPLQAKDISKGFEFLDLFAQLPENPFGPLVLSFVWHFRFTDPATKIILPGQELIPEIDFRLHNSQLYLRLGQKSTVSVWFTFPFPELNKQSEEYFSLLLQTLPFKPSARHWRLWKKSKNGNWSPKVIEINFD